jgi:hypothetical protein
LRLQLGSPPHDTARLDGKPHQQRYKELRV